MTLCPQQLRAAFGRFVTGVTVVTAQDPAGAPVGFTANSFASVSLDPPLVLVCPGAHLSTFDVFCNASRFGISVLAQDQRDVSNLFASRNSARFAACDWHLHDTGVPLIAGRAAGFVCEAVQAINAGDHVVLIGRVIHFDDAHLPGLGYGPQGYFEPTKEQTIEASPAKATTASILLHDSHHIYLRSDAGLPTVKVPQGDTPLRALSRNLEASGIRFKPDLLYAVYDEAPCTRHMVFRGRATGIQPGLTPCLIARAFAHYPQGQPLHALLSRFAREHQAQNFGLYIGNAVDGDVMHKNER